MKYIVFILSLLISLPAWADTYAYALFFSGGGLKYIKFKQTTNPYETLDSITDYGQERITCVDDNNAISISKRWVVQPGKITWTISQCSDKSCTQESNIQKFNLTVREGTSGLTITPNVGYYILDGSYGASCDE